MSASTSTSYAVLGATGHIGGTILQLLLEESEAQLNLYVRSKSKILTSHPGIDDNPRVKIFEGDLTDTDLIQRCIKGTKAIFMAVALSENLPDCTIAIDTSRIVVSALDQLRESQQPLPRLIVLSSSSVSPQFWTGIPWFVHSVIYNANRNIYVDLENAESFLRRQDLDIAFIKPGGLTDDVRRGYKFDTKQTHTPMSFLDLAASMIDVANCPDSTWKGKDVSIVPETPGQGARMQFMLPYALVKGLLATYLPSLYMRVRGWVP